MHIERNMPAEIKKLIPDNPRVLIQGATGKEALRAIPAMRSYGTTVVAGVTPGKGGQTVEGVPVFNTVREAIASEGSVSMIVPRKGLKLGMIGGDTPTRTFSEGSIAVLSKSGGMTSEIAHILKKSGLGVSFAAGLGGERVPGTDPAPAPLLPPE